MNKVAFSLAVFSLLLYGCGNSTSEKSTIQIEVAEQNEHHHDDESEAIELNNGARWQVDENMMPHIRNMESDVISFAKVERRDYKALSKKLQPNIDMLTSNCTMTGKAHDELHKWLLPYIDMVTALSEAIDETEKEKQFQKIENSFVTFNQYFQ